jgi:hypothetical protein
MPQGTHIFRVNAENTGGVSDWSASSNSVVVPVPPCHPFCSG